MSEIISVIKYESNNEMLIFKHPVVDFNYGSQLIVHESQEAVFFKDGRALETFHAGAHTLDTKNLAILKKGINTLAKGENLFHAEVYFINLTTQLGIKWGTDSKIRLFDPVSGLHLEIGASGTFNLKVKDGRKLLLKVVGTSSGFEPERVFDSIGYSINQTTHSFKGMIIQKVKTTLAKLIRENDINILEVDEYLEVLSNEMKIKINEILEDYGVYIPEFFITTIITPDDDPNFRKLKEQHAARYLKVQEQRIKKDEALAAQEVAIVLAETESKTRIINAEADATSEIVRARGHGEALKAQGADYSMETARIIGTKAAENESGGAGSIVGELVKAGVGIGIGSKVAQNVVETVEHASLWECKKCGHKWNRGNFCEHCGGKKQ